MSDDWGTRYAPDRTSPISLQSSPDASDEETSKKVAPPLKVIPKKKVKGNESSVWGEMEVLRGLDHPNIVRIPFYRFCVGCAMAQTLMRGVER